MNSAVNLHLHDQRPRSVLECLRPDGGGIDHDKYQQYMQFMQGESNRRIVALVNASYAAEMPGFDGERSEEYDLGTDKPKKRRKKRGVWARRTEDGEREILRPEQSSWHTMYVDNDLVEEEDLLAAKFRTRFRLPYDNFKELVEECKKSPFFRRWHGTDAAKKPSSPIELLVLGALRYLGRGWTFDDLEESTAISRDVHRVFFHAFIDFGSTTLYDRYVIAPTTAEESKRHMKEFEKAGFHGCPGSSDCTHITTERCQYNLKNNHLGGKSSQTTRTFNLIESSTRLEVGQVVGMTKPWFVSTNSSWVFVMERFFRTSS